MPVFLANADVFDGEGAELLPARTVVVEDGKIAAVVPAGELPVPEGAERLDLSGKILMPGMIDCHMHLLLNEVSLPETAIGGQYPGGGALPNIMAHTAYFGAYAARRVLDAGFTTVFDGGGVDFIDVALREAIDRGFVEGPHYNICGQQITAGRSHFPGLGIEAHGEWEMRRAVRTMLWYGVNHIKIKMSAPMRMPGRNTERSEFTREELRAAVDEAHSAGLPVSVHARGAAPIMDSLLAGVDRIVHGTGISDEAIDFMLKHDIYLYPTLDSPPREPGPAMRAGKSRKVLDGVRRKGAEHWESARRAYAAGVKMALSTDCGVMGVEVGGNAEEVLRLRELGMSNLEALRAATSVAAHAVGRDDVAGAIRPGLGADLIVVDDDPLRNLETVTRVRLVMKAGRVVKNNL